MREASFSRATRETEITARVNLDGNGKATIDTGIGFFDHMLTALAVHSGMDIDITAKGDLAVDGHHTVEDTGLVLGQAIGEALGDKGGITRFGFAQIPMDEALASVAIDLSGRPYLVFNGSLTNGRVGGFDCCLTEEFFKALTAKAGITVHINLLYGENNHHKIEAIFKAFAHALQMAVTQSGNEGALSSKGML